MPAVRVAYPASQRYTRSLLSSAFAARLPEWVVEVADEEKEQDGERELRNGKGKGKEAVQWADYDLIDWDAVDQGGIANSYCIRKALIRKNHLAHTLALYVAKHPSSALVAGAPKTVVFSLSYADELDELLQDELYDVSVSLQANEDKAEEEKEYWILKPALADGGMGIRLFSTQEELEAIFQSFEDEEASSDEEEDEEEADEKDGSRLSERKDTGVSSSLMREWVVQSYASAPLLLVPAQKKFHLRVYVLAVGAIKVYVYREFLALHAGTAWAWPPSREGEEDDEEYDLAAHLTNTCLQDGQLEGSVSTLRGLEGGEIAQGPLKGTLLGAEQIDKVEEQVGAVVGDVFKAAVSSGSGFQPLPNAFELFGLDFLVSSTLDVSLLEVNACPDFAQSGEALQSVIQGLFEATIELAVEPLVEGSGATDEAEARETRMRKVLDLEIGKGW